jgi:hypothetical protein
MWKYICTISSIKAWVNFGPPLGRECLMVRHVARHGVLGTGPRGLYAYLESTYSTWKDVAPATSADHGSVQKRLAHRRACTQCTHLTREAVWFAADGAGGSAFNGIWLTHESLYLCSVRCHRMHVTQLGASAWNGTSRGALLARHALVPCDKPSHTRSTAFEYSLETMFRRPPRSHTFAPSRRV